MRVLTGADVGRLLPMDAAIGLMRESLALQSSGEVIQPLRQMLRPHEDLVFGCMPASFAGGCGAKLATAASGRVGAGSHAGLVVVFDGRDGTPLAVMDADAVTAIRTAAVSAVATDVLARPDARCLAILGAGTQARSHLEALAHVRRFEVVRLWGRSRDHGERCAAWAHERLGMRVDVVASAEEAARDADVICTVTASRTPVLEDVHVCDGAHVNAIGSSSLGAQEIETALVLRADVFVDSVASAIAEAGDLQAALQADAALAGRLRELGDVIAGRAAGRRDAAAITLFESVGLAIEDVAAGCHVARAAAAGGVGAELKLASGPYAAA